LTSIDITTYTNGLPSTVNTQIAYGTNGIDNPTSYGSNTLTWTWGDQLKSFSNVTYDLSYSYNDGGFRTKKVVTNKQTNSTVTTNYILDGDKVVYETDGTNTIHYTYDAVGNLLSLNVNGTEYYYLFNTQGDIIGLLNGSGSLVVSYQYDAWGNSTSISGTLKDTIGQLNPYRYRGYRYDTETGLYYLNARYYNSEWGRFLNGDSFGGEVGTLLSHNVFAYGLNNPVNKVDPSGLIPVDVDMYSVGFAGIRVLEILIAAISKIGKIVKSLIKGTSKDKSSGDKGISKDKSSGNKGKVVLNSFDDIASNPKDLWGKSSDEVAEILGEGWTKGKYGSSGNGWKFIKGDMSIFYHPGGGRHGGSYYGFSSSKLGKNKIVDKNYKPTSNDKATIILID
jgi:RHS repeat-associated protein